MTGATPLAGVLGWPIGHSLSPRLHAHWLRRHHLDGHYIPLGVQPEDLAATLRLLPRLGFRGVNVTIPHKEVVTALAATVSERAERIGSANTLTFRDDGGFDADSTDGFGFLANLRQCEPGWSAASGPALVIGAGGAARAIVDALLSGGAPMVRLANRSRPRAEALRGHFGDRVVVVDWDDAPGAMEAAMTIVNATSLGMVDQPELDLRLDAAPADAVVTDLVYRPLVTPFLAAARARGLKAVDGLGMLLHQAAPGFEAWFGRRPDIDGELRAAVLAP